MDVLISTMIIVGIVIIAIGIVVISGNAIIGVSQDSAEFREAENSMSVLDNYIKQVASEGIGSARKFEISFPETFEVLPAEDSIQYRLDTTTEVFDYLSRSVREDISRISESDVECRTEENSLVLENSYIIVEFQRIDKTDPMEFIDTAENIKYITEKSETIALDPVNTSVVIDSKPETAQGTGYTELLKEGSSPLCTVHVFVNSTVVYDIFYRLYSGADFIVMEVANIRVMST
jgi:type II secretory pathway pseudopilin PulG